MAVICDYFLCGFKGAPSTRARPRTARTELRAQAVGVLLGREGASAHP